MRGFAAALAGGLLLMACAGGAAPNSTGTATKPGPVAPRGDQAASVIATGPAPATAEAAVTDLDSTLAELDAQLAQLDADLAASGSGI